MKVLTEKEDNHEDLPFLSLCRLASQENWCWKIICTTCGHMHFRYGFKELIGTGTTYEADAFNANLAPNCIDIVEYNGGDVEDPASYSDPISILFPEDQLDSFDLVVRDSAGVITEYRESGDLGGEFVSKLAFLGDPDNDGFTDVSMGFQGIDNSTFVFN